MGAGWQERRWGRAGGRGFNNGRGPGGAGGKGSGMRRGRGRGGGGGGGGGGPPQPSFANVIYLPDHENAIDSSTAITDLATGGSANPHVFAFNNQAHNDTGDSAFGSGSSILFDGVNDWINRAGHADFRPSSAEIPDTAQHCFEAHVKRTGATGDVFTRYNASANRRALIFGITTGSKMNISAWQTGGSGGLLFAITGTTVLNAGQWYHVAMARENDFTATPGSEDIVRLFVDGVKEAEFVLGTSEGYTPDSVVGILFGDRSSGGGDLNGRIDNIRISIGEPVYTDNFTPPTARHPTS